jgi:hypothetical protein
MRRSFCIVLFLAACSDGNGGGGGTGGGAGDASPCDLATAGDVQTVFGGSVADGVPGTARNCEFTIQNGASDTVNVFLYSTHASTEWQGIRDGYDANRGGTTDVPGVGDQAYSPNDVGQTEVVVQDEEVVFAVQSIDFTNPDPTRAEKVLQLAKNIAAK